MKNLQEKINENLIVEAAAKNVHNPRKGSTIYLLKDGDSKAIKTTIKDVRKVKNSWYGKSGGYDINIELSDNAYGITGWREPHYGGDWDYSDEKYQVQTITFSKMFMNSDSGSGTFYIGVSTEAIQQFINTKGSDKLEGLLKEIEKKQAELDELMQKKQKAEAEANLEVNESKNI